MNIECELLWERQNFENSKNVVIALKTVHICMNSDRYDQNKLGRYGKTGFMYNINSPRNPDTGEVVSKKFGKVELY